MVKIRRKGNRDSKVIEVPFESFKADYEKFGYELVNLENREERSKERQEENSNINREDNRPKRK